MIDEKIIGDAGEGFCNIGEYIQRGIEEAQNHYNSPAIAFLGFVFTKDGYISCVGNTRSPHRSTFMKGVIEMSIMQGILTREDVQKCLDEVSAH